MITADTIRQALQCDNPSCECHKPNGKVHCPTPGHRDIHPSFSVDSGGNGKVLVKCRSQCRDNQDLPLNALKSRGLWPSSNGNGKPKFNIIEVYDYHDPAGKMVYQVCRTDTKEFPQRRPDPAQHGKWIWNLKGVTRYPYRLPELLKAETAYFVEGEKDVNQLMAMRFTATTSPEGAGNYRKEFNPYFKGKAVVIFPDNDPPGKAHAQDVARNLHDVAASVKVVELPGLPEKGDVSDWIKAGGTKEQLLALVEVAPELDPANLTPQSIEEPETDPKPTQQDILLTIASVAESFHTPDEDGYGIIPINDHRETWPIRSKGFRRWLSHEFFKSQKKGPQPEAVSSVLQVLEAQAQFDGPERPVWVRIAEHDGAIYLDLGNDSWEAIKITKVGWEVVTDPPVCFRRTRSMMALPYPAKGGTFNELRPFLNAATDDDFILMVAYLIGAMRPRGPYPVIVLNGEQGSAKSTAARVIAFLIDPSFSPLRSAPREVRDLMIAAINSWILGFDNLSGVSDWLSDAMCRLSTGGGFGTRELYTDREESIFEATRPLILNGIDTLARRQDLADRSLIFNLPQIDDKDRRPESRFWADFEAARPRILGALLDAVSMALRKIDSVNLPSLPRMADFAMWVSAAEPALPWPTGSFMEAYMGNRAEAVELSLEADCVAVAVREHMADQLTWTGKPSKLYEELEKRVPENTKRSKSWPKAANKLSGRLKRAATFLRAIGIDVEIGWSKSKGREVILRRIIQGRETTVGTVGTVEVEKPCGFSSHDTKSGTVEAVESTVGNRQSSHGTDGPSHDTKKEAWERKINNHEVIHGSHDTQDTFHTPEGDVEEFGI